MAFNRRYATPWRSPPRWRSCPGHAAGLCPAGRRQRRGAPRRSGRRQVTIKHDAIKALDLPAMTLVYEADPALLAKIKAGDKVKFTAERKDGKYVVTAISN